MDYILSKLKSHTLLAAVQASNVFLSFHYYLILYLNSSYLSQFFTESQVSVLYLVGSCLDLLLLLNVTKILAKIGAYRLTLYAIITECIAIFGMAFTTTPHFMALYFMLQLVCIPTILFNLDIFLESASTDESQTGSIRATYLTLSNATLVICPTIVSFILTRHNYAHVYAVSLLFLVPLYACVHVYFKKFVDSTVAQSINLKETVSTFLHDKNLGDIFSAYFILQLFYAYMVVYTPIYLSHYIGFSWSEIGIMLTIILLPFVLFELPAGTLADKKYGEKEILTLGFVIMGLATLVMSFITIKSFVLWTVVLFVTRTGAALVEVTSDSYFFKHVDQSKANIIGLYRSCRPLSFMTAAILVTLSVQFFSYHYIFLPLGIIIIFGTKWSLALNDTK